MSGDTVTGNALQFTNDNKYAYANSGVFQAVAGVTADTRALIFSSNSEYLDSKITLAMDEIGGAQIFYIIKLNDTIVHQAYSDSSSSQSWFTQNPLYLIIPPFTECEILVGANATVLFTAMFQAKVGMPQRVGNLDE